MRMHRTEIVSGISGRPPLLVGITPNELRPVVTGTDHRHDESLSARITNNKVLPPHSHVSLPESNVSGIVIGRKTPVVKNLS